MGKTDTIHELTNIAAIALRHRIGSIVNPDEIYAQKYAKDADIIMKEAQKTAMKENWNDEDIAKIEKELKRKLKLELEKKKFIPDEKFMHIEKETAKAIEELNLQKEK